MTKNIGELIAECERISEIAKRMMEAMRTLQKNEEVKNKVQQSMVMDVLGARDNGAMRIFRERYEQIHKHGRTNDEKWESQQLRIAARKLLITDSESYANVEVSNDRFTPPDCWDKELWNKMLLKPYSERIVIAGALLAAELDRINGIKY